MKEDFGARADALVGRILPLLAGEQSAVQVAVINELVALWIAGHRAADARLREELLQLHTEHVRELVELYLGDADG